MKFLFKLSLIAIVLLSFVSCSSKDESPNNSEPKAKLALRLTDAPGDYEKVFIDLKQVFVKYASGEDLNLGINPDVYDLMELTAGVSALLFNDEVPTGNITQIRLVLGDNNTIVVDGETFPLETPSAQQSGLKIQLDKTLEEGILYEFLLDFDVDQSIVALGNGGYNLNPVIRATTVAESGAISGTILSFGILSLVTAENDTDRISTYANRDGEFLISGVPPGNYNITIELDVNLEMPPTEIENVIVVQGEVTSIGVIDLGL